MQQNKEGAFLFPPSIVLVRRPDAAGTVEKTAPRSKWRTLAFTFTAAMLFGAAIAAVGLRGQFVSHVSRVNGASPRIYVIPPIQVAGPPVPVETQPVAEPTAEDEIEKLQVRNRRLEALVDVLRQRAGRTSSTTNPHERH